MSGRKCSYFNCENVQRNCHKTFHTFPSDSDMNLLKKWIIHADSNTSDIYSPSPSKYPKVLTPSRNYSRENLQPRILFDTSPTTSITPTTKSWVSELINLPSIPKTHLKSNLDTKCPETLTKKNNTLKEKLQKLRRELKQKRAVICYLKKKELKNGNKPINIRHFFKVTKFPSANAKALMSMQILHKKRKPWSSSEKKLALSLYYKSPSTYKYMRRNGINLPGESTVRRWLNAIDFQPGFPISYLEQISLKTSEMTIDQRKCVILLDEVSIMKAVEYNKFLDKIEGFEDMGSLGRNDKIGTHALVIMVRGLYKNWKFPLSFFFTGNGIRGNDLVLIIKESVKHIFDVRLIPICIVCDQGTQNRRTFTLLGGTEEKPFTIVYNHKIFLIYDMPHLVKSIRNNLLNGDFQIGKKITSLNDVHKAYSIDSRNSARAMCKITPAHLAPNPFQKMTCKLAIQLLSKSVSATLKTCVATGELKSNTAINTAEFIEMVDTMFDSCNSKNLYDPNINRRPMNEKNVHVIDNLIKARSEFQRAKKICHRTKKSSTPPCFSGIVWTITAILELYQSEKVNISISRPDDLFLMTNRLTQDALENLFSIIRQKNGYNRNPTARTFRCCFGHICSYSLMKCTTSCNNCEPDDAEFMTVEVLKDIKIKIETESRDDEDKSKVDISFNESDDSDTSSMSKSPPIKSSLEKCATTYFAGYLAKKCLNNFKCEDCQLKLITAKDLEDENQILLTYKTFDYIGSTQGLKVPSKLLIQITNICLDVFIDMFPKIKAEKQILKKLMSTAEGKIKNIFDYTNSSCHTHFTFIIELLFRTKIFMACKWINANCKNKRELQNADKLNIFKNK